MVPFSPSAVDSGGHLLGPPGPDPVLQPPLAASASPSCSRSLPRRIVDFEELAPAVVGNFPDEDADKSGGTTGNRWLRQETLALLKIRSEMDASFRDATFKGPLWEEVSRKLAELGYKRSAKKCKEKFENVHKYYKRTKEGRAGRHDGKSYRFFSQLDALYSGSISGGGGATTSAGFSSSAPSVVAISPPFGAGMVGSPVSRAQPISAVAPPTMAMPTRAVVPDLTLPGGPQGVSSSGAAAATGLTFSSSSFSSSSSSESDDEETGAAGESPEGRKQKNGRGSGTSRKMMAFFDRLMKQVMERQDAMQQRFLEAIEKREQDRTIREEAWRRQEMGRLNREQELLVQERALAASRDNATISYLQKINSHTISTPTMPSNAPLPPQQPFYSPPAPPAATQQQSQPPTAPQQQQQRSPTLPRPPQQQHEVRQHHQTSEVVWHQSSSASEIVPSLEPQEAVGGGRLEPVSSSRWPRAEVHALINLRTGLESKYQEAGTKGTTLWEEISAGMQRLGYIRSAKRCKEKWENINKYFKKVKESNKKRPEDAKTCPYFHQLDALYRKKLLGSGIAGVGNSSGTGNTVGIQRQQGRETDRASNQQQSDAPTILPRQQAPRPPSPQQLTAEAESKNENGTSNQNSGNSESDGDSVGITSNGGLPPSLFDEGMKKVTTGPSNLSNDLCIFATISSRSDGLMLD
ncbi:unnamed protein product [Musa acuminata subsp. malaccensis]|uniref:(wild Malaysian banana) hypothetical protein n=1 Tax=Musa acuminata subsp. malaccensis TaxID=214687 RepID=A0A804KLD1_MUSAM|nr:unnamed protein product [Musa acuminata subsp. malaccensis]